MDQLYEPLELDTYNDVLKTKHLIHHIEKIPLPFPMTILGLCSCVALEVFFFAYVNTHSVLEGVLFHVFIPFGVAAWITHYEPEGINGFQVFYAFVRRMVKPKRKIVNRPVACRTQSRRQVEQPTRVDLVEKGVAS